MIGMSLVAPVAARTSGQASPASCITVSNQGGKSPCRGFLPTADLGMGVAILLTVIRMEVRLRLGWVGRFGVVPFWRRMHGAVEKMQAEWADCRHQTSEGMHFLGQSP
jgi:hypothetical protein